MTTRNEATERLLDVMGELRHLQANERTALRNSIRAVIAAERRATVKRIRAKAEVIEWTGDLVAGIHAWHVGFLAFLDEEAVR